MEQIIGGTELTERPGSYSLVLTLAGSLIVLGLLWSAGAATKLVGHWPSVAQAGTQIETAASTAKTALVDDSGLLYYMYRKLDTDKITTPFFNNYKNLSGGRGLHTGYHRSVL